MGASSSSLHEAVSEGNVKKLQRLLKKNAGKVNDAHNAGTLLLQAVKANNPEVVALLLKYKAKPNMISHIRTVATNPDSHFIYDWTAIHEAARQGGGESMELLLAHGGNKDLHAQNLMPPLHVAAWYHETEAVRTLIDAGCDVNQLDYLCESAMVIPICQGDTEMVQLLLTAGCKLNSRAWGNLRKTLVQGGRRQSQLRGLDGPGPYSLLSLAVIRTWPHIAILLLQHGYDPNKCEIYSLVKGLRYSLVTLGEMARRVIACFLAAGHTPRHGDTQLIDNLQLPPNQGFDTASLDWIKSQFAIHSLKQLCRNSIRQQVRKLTEHASIMSRLQALADVLPPTLVGYLTLAEFATEELPRFRSMMLLFTGPILHDVAVHDV